MNKEHQKIALAVLDGCMPQAVPDFNYPERLDLLMPMVRRLSPEMWANYRSTLWLLIAGSSSSHFDSKVAPLYPPGFTKSRAYNSPIAEHVAEALLRIHGAWIEGDSAIHLMQG